ALQRDRYLMGKELALFEQEFSRWQDVEHTIGVANGTDAILLALQALDVTRNNFVVTPSLTAVATVNAIARSGAIPLFVDVDPDTGTLCPDSLERALEKGALSRNVQIAAIVVVHLYGFPADMTRITAIAEEYDIPIVEDVAQAHGARWQGTRVGTFGSLAAFSFYPTKNLAALGDAGAVTTDQLDVAERIRALRQYGWNEDRIAQEIGLNSRLDELQAAILRIRLRHLDQETRRRRQIADDYFAALETTSLSTIRAFPHADPVFHQFIVRTAKREQFRQFLLERKIQTAIHYERGVHQHPAYWRFYEMAKSLDVDVPLTHTEQLVEEVVSLPMYPQLSDGEVERVCQACLQWSQEQKRGRHD
ncbi:MAG: erythromycin biosynthesis sensory transduction protein eryC1, partial [Planctomyces sp.]|nr:erythromycin biosynthesis sensory transduction protein eryC1 [Planctomyces sp.]